MAKRVFEPFFTTKEIGRGTGLGLATVWGIVRQHQGFLCIETKPGEGSSFQVYLPAESEVRAPVEMVGAQHPLTGSETILLVEDHDALRDSAQEMLQSLGYRIIPASDGRNAVNLFRQYADQIDLVVMDVIMPLKGGVDAYLELSEMRPSVGVIFTSGYTTKSEPLITLLERGAMFVQKPYDLSTLNQMIRRALDHKRPH